MDKEIAIQIVNAIFYELGDRKGLDNELDAIIDDEEVYDEMHDACVQRVMAVAEGGPTERFKYWDPRNRNE